MRRFVTILAVLALPATASAATPDKGSVSTATPKVEWTGTLQNPYLFHNVFNYETPGTVPCQAPGCDTFTLDVAEGGVDLNVEVASDQTEDMSLRIQDPSGTWAYYPGWGDASKPTKVRIKKAAKGTYVINVVARVFGTSQPTAVTDTADYKGAASLAIVPVAAPVAPAPVAVAAPAPAAASQPAAKKPAASKKAACTKKAKKIKNKRKRKAALKRCAKKR
jgi:hypothetical protein